MKPLKILYRIGALLLLLLMPLITMAQERQANVTQNPQPMIVTADERLIALKSKLFTVLSGQQPLEELKPILFSTEEFQGLRQQFEAANYPNLSASDMEQFAGHKQRLMARFQQLYGQVTQINFVTVKKKQVGGMMNGLIPTLEFRLQNGKAFMDAIVIDYNGQYKILLQDE